MAITQTGAIYKSLSFDNTSSRNYGVYITGEAVYNAPERAVEMISIPGRNGAFALDQGRFENIEVSYPAGIFAENEADFSQAVSDFRNFLCSKKGYCRLTDEYNPNEYRMAVYKSGLEVDSAQLKAGEFTITFECKPQRWLTSGETATTVANNGTLTNPTLFEASPLLEVEGYGTIEFNGYEIELINEVMGTVVLADEKSVSGAGVSQNLVKNIMNNGDTFSIYPSSYFWSIGLNEAYGAKSVTISSVSDSDSNVQTVQAGNGHYTNVPSIQGVYGTALTYTNTTTIVGSYVSSNNTSHSFTMTLTTRVNYTVGSVHRYAFVRLTSGLPAVLSMNYTAYPSTMGRVMGDSTVSLLGHPTKVDCDLGEAYKEVNGDIVSLNKYIDLGSDLPTLASGNNTITYDNTITDLKIKPHWWKV